MPNIHSAPSPLPLPPVTPPETLAVAITQRVITHARFELRMRLIFDGVLFFGSIGMGIAAFGTWRHDFLHSGFAPLLQVLFSNFGIAQMHSYNFLMSLLASMPTLDILSALFLLLIMLLSAYFMVLNVQKFIHMKVQNIDNHIQYTHNKW
ncbi:hypothetical protein M1534_00275 [Patescibacteria group bacterium]|nr:hypothetical protein [Patescibacteria group bacterium]